LRSCAARQFVTAHPSKDPTSRVGRAARVLGPTPNRSANAVELVEDAAVGKVLRLGGHPAAKIPDRHQTDLIILDDWGLAKFTAEQRRDLLELLDDPHGNRSTLVTSQVPVDHWHDVIGDPTLGDAILDRLVHNAYPINLKEESMRKRHAKFTSTASTE